MDRRQFFRVSATTHVQAERKIDLSERLTGNRVEHGFPGIAAINAGFSSEAVRTALEATKAFLRGKFHLAVAAGKCVSVHAVVAKRAIACWSSDQHGWIR